MVASVARTAASRIPWDKLVKVVLPIVIDEIRKLLAKIGKRKPPKIEPDSTPEAKIEALETYVEGVEEDLKEAVEALQKTATELSALASAARVLTARVTVALFISGSAIILGVACWLFVLFHG
jgi:ATP/maltotriose-dependent transcriptional regulator MalT